MEIAEICIKIHTVRKPHTIIAGPPWDKEDPKMMVIDAITLTSVTPIAKFANAPNIMIMRMKV